MRRSGPQPIHLICSRFMHIHTVPGPQLSNGTLCSNAPTTPYTAHHGSPIHFETEAQVNRSAIGTPTSPLVSNGPSISSCQLLRRLLDGMKCDSSSALR
ncbi:hypothetical protein PCANC_07272 [Puccinia coronata f. sp. avenae]|uniref:Uncharacterized protein n=1 Tax=Puccinia coronata f. sp. avenae TaxID=200324 RepID=A0A2N5VRY0_9BASI|nr:hypothetical protein PCANC_07272 [Puccinia coronata f. sp. avenae]